MNEVVFSEAMNELSDKYITEAIEYKAKKRSGFSYVMKAAAVACLLVVLSFGTVMAVNAEVRAAVIGWIKQQYYNFFEYSYEGAPIEDAPTAYEIGWLPDGCEYVHTIEEPDGKIFIYTDEKDMLIRFSYTLPGGNSTVGIDGVDYIQEKATVNGMDAELYLAPEEGLTSGIVWKNEYDVLFFIAGPFEADILTEMAESVVPKEAENIKYELGSLPEGCEFVTSYEIPDGEAYVYTDKNSFVIQFTYSSSAEGTSLFVEGGEYEETTAMVNDIQADIYLATDETQTNAIVWSEGNTIFYISAPYDIDGLVEMAESVVPKESEPLRFEPGWMPEDAVLIDNFDTAGGEAYIYSDDTNAMINFHYISEPENEKTYIGAEGSEIQSVMVNGCQGEIYISSSEEETNTIVWIDTENNVLFSFSGHYDAETLLKVAENVKIKE